MENIGGLSLALESEAKDFGQMTIVIATTIELITFCKIEFIAPEILVKT
jgi:hypothetical protein